MPFYPAKGRNSGNNPEDLFSNLVKVTGGSSYNNAVVGNLYLILRGDNNGNESKVNIYGGDVIWSDFGITGDGDKRGYYCLAIVKATSTKIGRTEIGMGHGGGGIWEFQTK